MATGEKCSSSPNFSELQSLSQKKKRRVTVDSWNPALFRVEFISLSLSLYSRIIYGMHIYTHRLETVEHYTFQYLCIPSWCKISAIDSAVWKSVLHMPPFPFLVLDKEEVEEFHRHPSTDAGNEIWRCQDKRHMFGVQASQAWKRCTFSVLQPATGYRASTVSPFSII